MRSQVGSGMACLGAVDGIFFLVESERAFIAGIRSRNNHFG